MRARQRSQFLRRRLFAENDRVIFPHSKVIIPLLLVFFLDNRDFLFHLTVQINLILFAHLIHHDITKVLVRNTSNQPLCILHHQKLGHVVDICYDNYILINAESTLNSVTFLPQTSPFFEHESSYIPTPANPSMESRLDNKVRVYGDKYAVTLLAQLVADYPSIWESKDFV